METCRVGLYQRGDGGGMINRKQNLPDYLEEGTEEGPIYQQNCYQSKLAKLVV